MEIIYREHQMNICTGRPRTVFQLMTGYHFLATELSIGITNMQKISNKNLDIPMDNYVIMLLLSLPVVLLVAD